MSLSTHPLEGCGTIFRGHQSRIEYDFKNELYTKNFGLHHSTNVENQLFYFQFRNIMVSPVNRDGKQRNLSDLHLAYLQFSPNLFVMSGNIVSICTFSI